MGRDGSPAKRREEHFRVLGPQLGPLYSSLYDEITWLHAKWQQYRQLYATPETVKLLNQIAGFFFRVVQDVLWEDLLLHIARLIDQPKTKRAKENLTLLRLAPGIDEPKLAREVRTLVKNVERESAFAVDWRMRRLAHRDLALALNERSAQPLPGVSRERMKRALSAITLVMNKIEGHFWNSEVAFDYIITQSDAETLTYYLRLAAKAHDQRLEGLRQGRPLPEDLEP
mgnify:CR=1 FL=1